MFQKETYKKLEEAISQNCITLVKYKDRSVLPIIPERYKRIMIVHVKGAGGPVGELMKMIGKAKTNAAELLKKKLCDKGFQAFIYESPLEHMKKQAAAGETPNLNLYFAGKNAIRDFIKDMELVITLCDVSSGRPCPGFNVPCSELYTAMEINVLSA